MWALLPGLSRGSVRQHAAGDIDFRYAIIIEVDPIGAPSPAAHLESFGNFGGFECSVAAVTVKRIAAGVPAVRVAHSGVRCRGERFVLDDALTRGRPHIAHVKVQPPIDVVVEPCSAHPGPYSVHTGSLSDISETPLLVSVEVVASEIVGHAKVRPPIAIEVAPCWSKTVPVVIFVHAAGCGDILEKALSVLRELVVEQVVRRAVPRIEIRDRVAVLILTLEVDIRTKVKVDPAIEIVVSGSRSGESALRGRFEAKSFVLMMERPVSAVQEQQRSSRGDYQQVLPSDVSEIHKQGGDGVVQYANTGAFREVLHRAIRPPPVEPVRQPGRLTHINLVPSVSIDISNRDAVVSVNVDSAGRIQTPPPIWHATAQLEIKRLRPSEYRGRYIFKQRLRRLDQGLRERFEA